MSHECAEIVKRALTKAIEKELLYYIRKSMAKSS